MVVDNGELLLLVVGPVLVITIFSLHCKTGLRAIL